MIAVIFALILTFASSNTEASVVAQPAQVAQEVQAQVTQTEREQALEASAWESLSLIESIELISEDTVVEYSHTVTVEDGTYSILPTEFAVVDPYDDVYVHIFNVAALSHA